MSARQDRHRRDRLSPAGREAVAILAEALPGEPIDLVVLAVEMGNQWGNGARMVDCLRRMLDNVRERLEAGEIDSVRGDIARSGGDPMATFVVEAMLRRYESNWSP
jgi:hypothetical protein